MTNPLRASQTEAVAHTLTGGGFDASEDGSGRGVPLVAVPHVEIMPTLRAAGAQSGAGHGARSGHSKDEYVVPIVFDTTQITHPANSSRCEPGAPCHTLPKDGHPPAVAFQSSQSGMRVAETHATLDSHNGSRRHHGAVVSMQVRRLTPKECERLQAFPDNYTLIVFNKKPAKDGPRYKALGNSMCVSVMRWIGKAIDDALWCEEHL